MEPAVSVMVDTLLHLGRLLSVLAFFGMAVSCIALNQTSEKNIPDYCTSGWFEYMRTWVFASTSLGCSMNSVLAATWAKLRLAVLFREKVDNTATLVTRWILFFSQTMLGAGYASVGLMMFYLFQLNSRKFSCMGTGTQAVLVGCVSGLAMALLLLLSSMYRLTFDLSHGGFHERVMQTTSQKDEESNCCMAVKESNCCMAVKT